MNRIHTEPRLFRLELDKPLADHGDSHAMQVGGFVRLHWPLDGGGYSVSELLPASTLDRLHGNRLLEGFAFVMVEPSSVGQPAPDKQDNDPELVRLAQERRNSPGGYQQEARPTVINPNGPWVWGLNREGKKVWV